MVRSYSTSAFSSYQPPLPGQKYARSIGSYRTNRSPVDTARDAEDVAAGWEGTGATRVDVVREEVVEGSGREAGRGHEKLSVGDEECSRRSGDVEDMGTSDVDGMLSSGAERTGAANEAEPKLVSVLLAGS